MKISMTVLELQSGYNFETNNFKGALFYKRIVAGVTVLVFYTLSVAALYLYEVS